MLRELGRTEQGRRRGTVTRAWTRALVTGLLACLPVQRAWSQAGPALVPGARVRVVMREAGLLPDGTVDRTRPAEAEGRYVALDSATLTLRLHGWRGLALPRGMVRGLEVRDGAGFCAAHLGGRLACLGLGLSVALSVGGLASFGFGRSRWVPVRGWPTAPAPSGGG